MWEPSTFQTVLLSSVWFKQCDTYPASKHNRNRIIKPQVLQSTLKVISSNCKFELWTVPFKISPPCNTSSDWKCSTCVCLQVCWSASVSLRTALYLRPRLLVFNMVRKGCCRHHVGGTRTWTSKCHVGELLLDAITRGCEHLKLITFEGELWSSSSLALTVTPITAPALL